MKFGKFLDYAEKRGFGRVATGHYCSLRENPDGSRDLVQAADPSKDQSYFLCMITQRQRQHAMFPIGSLLKSEVRDIARMNGLPNAEKRTARESASSVKSKFRTSSNTTFPKATATS